MASDALWVAWGGLLALGYQDSHFDVKEGEDFKNLKITGEKGGVFEL